jgi:hypothetical protein
MKTTVLFIVKLSGDCGFDCGSCPLCIYTFLGGKCNALLCKTDSNKGVAIWRDKWTFDFYVDIRIVPVRCHRHQKNFNYNTLRKMYMRAKLPTSDFDSQTAYKHTHAYENHVRLQPVRYGWCWFVLREKYCGCWWHVCSERKVLLAGCL